MVRCMFPSPKEPGDAMPGSWSPGSDHLEVELAHHGPDHMELLVVLLAENRCVRRNNIEQLRHHRAHSLEMAPSKRAAQLLGRFRRRDGDFLRNWIHLALVGREEHLAS